MSQRIATLPASAAANAPLTMIRARLDEQRLFRTDQLEELASNAVGATDTSDGTRRQVARVLRMGAESVLAEIDAALERLADGSYGTCERCLESIPSERLEVLPSVRLCTNCQFLTEAADDWKPPTALGRV